MEPKLMLHRGAVQVGYEDLKEIPLPEETNSYKPVSHTDLVNNIQSVASRLLPNYTFRKGQYGLNREGQQLFAIHQYQNGSDDMGLSIGFRNSYDKSMSVGIAMGASVFVCDNMALSGNVTIMRKHTANVWEDLQDMLITTLFKAEVSYHNVVRDAEHLKMIDFNDTQAYELLGYLYGNNVVTPRQIPVVKNEWLKPSHEEFEPRNKWSFYNAVTEALKSTPARQIMEKHILLHDICMN